MKRRFSKEDEREIRALEKSIKEISELDKLKAEEKEELRLILESLEGKSLREIEDNDMVRVVIASDYDNKKSWMDEFLHEKKALVTEAQFDELREKYKKKYGEYPKEPNWTIIVHGNQKA